MSVIIVSLVNYDQTIDSVTLPAYDTQTRSGSTITSDMTDAITLRKIQAMVIDDTSESDMSGAAIVSAIDDQLGNDIWRAGPDTLPISITDEVSVIEATENAFSFRMPYGRSRTLIGVRASLKAPSTDGDVQVSLYHDGDEILTAPLTIEEDELVATTSSFTINSLEDDAVISVDIDNAGDEAVGLKIYLTFAA